MPDTHGGRPGPSQVKVGAQAPVVSRAPRRREGLFMKQAAFDYSYESDNSPGGSLSSLTPF